MTDHVYKTLELTGSSTSSMEDAVRHAVEKAAKSVRNMRWFQVTETRGVIADNAISYWQVTIKVGFALDD
jgi:dodecin